MFYIIPILFAVYLIFALKHGIMSKNRAIGSAIMMAVAMFLGNLAPIIGIFLTILLAFANAFYTPIVIENFLNDLGKKE